MRSLANLFDCGQQAKMVRHEQDECSRLGGSGHNCFVLKVARPKAQLQTAEVAQTCSTETGRHRASFVKTRSKRFFISVSHGSARSSPDLFAPSFGLLFQKRN